MILPPFYSPITSTIGGQAPHSVLHTSTRHRLYSPSCTYPLSGGCGPSSLPPCPSYSYRYRISIKKTAYSVVTTLIYGQTLKVYRMHVMIVLIIDLI